MINGSALNTIPLNAAPSAGGGGTFAESILEDVTAADLISAGALESLFDEMNVSDLTYDNFAAFILENLQVPQVLSDLSITVLSEAMTIVHATIQSRLLQFFENITVDDTLSDDVWFGIVESIQLSSTLSSSAVVQNILTSDFSVDEIIKILFTGNILENIEVTQSETLSSLFISSVVEALSLDDTIDNKLIALSQIALQITLADAITHGQSGSVSENLEVADSTVDLLNSFGQILEAIEVVLTSTDTLLLTSVLTDEFTVDDLNSSSSVLIDQIIEGLQMITLPDDGNTAYSTWVMNPETFSIWNYDNYNFNSLATLNRKTFLANETGLYSMEGSRDITSFITSKLKTASLDFGTTNLKKVPNMYIGASTDGDILVRVSTDERVNVTYRLNSPTIVNDLQRIEIGKGLYGSLWQFEILDVDADNFRIKDIEWIPAVFGRKRR